MRNWRIVRQLGIGVLLVAGCSSNQSDGPVIPEAPLVPAGTYVLRTISGVAIPGTVATSFNGPAQFNYWVFPETLTITATNAATWSTAWRLAGDTVTKLAVLHCMLNTPILGRAVRVYCSDHPVFPGGITAGSLVDAGGGALQFDAFPPWLDINKMFVFQRSP